MWGGKAGHPHEWEEQKYKQRTDKDCAGFKQATSTASRFLASGASCFCGAWRGELGGEPTPERYVQHLVEVFREVRRVLRSDGTLWLNLGSSYAGSWGNYGDRRGQQRQRNTVKYDRAAYDEFTERPPTATCDGWKPKDLIQIPFLVAEALRQDGWWLRSAITLCKLNPMPESVRDRPTSATEMIFLFAKGQWTYRVVQLTHLPDHILHRSENRRFESSYMGCYKICIEIATTILQSSEAQQQFSLWLLHPQERKQDSNDFCSTSVATLPPQQRLFRYAAGFLYANGSTKDFLKQLDSLGFNLANRNAFVIAGSSSQFPLTPRIYPKSQTAIAINNASEICEYDFVSHTFTISRPNRCVYYYDQEAVREPMAESSYDRYLYAFGGEKNEQLKVSDNPTAVVGHRIPTMRRNLRNWWPVVTEPLQESHYAAFGQKWIEPCLRAGTSERGCCATCGAPWEREVKREPFNASWQADKPVITGKWDGVGQTTPDHDIRRGPSLKTTTLCWHPTCSCHAETIPATILDPFCGSGTTGVVALKLGRSFIGVDLSHEYCKMARRRIEQVAPLFSSQNTLCDDDSRKDSAVGAQPTFFPLAQ